MAFLSFNPHNASALEYHQGDDVEAEDVLRKELPLKYTWVIWEQIMQASDGKAAQYSDATHKVAPFGTVQDFWKLWNHMPQPSELLDQKRMVREQPDGLHVIDAIMIFRDGIRPEWEDKLNASGGHFQFQLKPASGGGQIDEYWNNLVLGMIGGTIEPVDMITGVRLVDKLSGPRQANGIRIEVWFTDYDNTTAVNTLKKNVEKCMATRLDGVQGIVPKCDAKTHQSSQKH
ncbi:unnamed protein product [Amoebophrya sp. A120]|nr:unnamed protein product [Amoebophrya sp. A120]|eukprot:GSA120T00004154001.1